MTDMDFMTDMDSHTQVTASCPAGFRMAEEALRTVVADLPMVVSRTVGFRTSGIVVSSAGGVRSREKIVWDWSAPTDRLIEELR